MILMWLSQDFWTEVVSFSIPKEYAHEWFWKYCIDEKIGFLQWFWKGIEKKVKTEKEKNYVMTKISEIDSLYRLSQKEKESRVNIIYLSLLMKKEEKNRQKIREYQDAMSHRPVFEDIETENADSILASIL